MDSLKVKKFFDLLVNEFLFYKLRQSIEPKFNSYGGTK